MVNPSRSSVVRARPISNHLNLMKPFSYYLCTRSHPGQSSEAHTHSCRPVHHAHAAASTNALKRTPHACRMRTGTSLGRHDPQRWTSHPVGTWMGLEGGGGGGGGGRARKGSCVRPMGRRPLNPALPVGRSEESRPDAERMNGVSTAARARGHGAEHSVSCTEQLEHAATRRAPGRLQS